MSQAIAVLEVHGFAPAMVVADVAERTADVRLFEAELNDLYGLCLKFTGSSAALRVAVAAARDTARRLAVDCVATILDAPAREMWQAVVHTPHEVNPLIEAPIVFHPLPAEETAMSDPPFALGMIETQGFTAVIEAIDTACKAADVEVIGKEKLGGGYITVLIKGDVAAVEAAVAAGQARVGELGQLIAAHVIPRPSQAILRLLPKATG